MVSRSPSPPRPSPTRRKRTGAAAKNKNYVPRPMNAWMIYRKEKSVALRAEDKSLSQSSISQVVAKCWREEPKHVRDDYEQRAARHAQLHKLEYPNYKYQPKTKEEKARLKAAEKEEKAIRKKQKALPPPPATPLLQFPTQHVPYHLAAHNASSLGPSPPYSTGSLPSTVSTPSSSGEAYDSSTSTGPSALSSSTSHVSSSPNPDHPHYMMPGDHHSNASTIVPGSASTSRVPSGSTSFYQPSPSAPPPIDVGLHQWHLSEGPFLPNQPTEGPSHQFDANQPTEDLSQPSLFPDIPFDNLPNAPTDGQPSNLLELDLPTLQLRFGLDLEQHIEPVHIEPFITEGLDQSVFHLPNIPVESLEAGNPLQVKITPPELPAEMTSSENENYDILFQSLIAPDFDLFEAANQQSQVFGPMDAYLYPTLADNTQQYLNFDEPQFYPIQVPEPQLQQPQPVDPMFYMNSMNVVPQNISTDPSPAPAPVDSSSSYTPPPGASRASTRRVGGSWRPPADFSVATPPTGTPQYLAPMPSTPWNGLSTS